MNCFRCNKELEPAFSAGPEDQDGKEPHRGLIFSAAGNYGSRVYDPAMSAPQLIIWVCDECIVRYHDLVKMRSYVSVQTQVTWNDFDPERAYW